MVDLDDGRRDFCRMIRARSDEHRDAMQLISGAGHASVMVGLLRQELDSMVRVIYLLTTESRNQRRAFIESSLRGEPWYICSANGGKKKVTDRYMVDRATKLRGWTSSVYRFGCAFIHLSTFHDYGTTDPFLALEEREQKEILQHLRYYHGGPMAEAPAFSDLIPLFPRVLEKISSNLEGYVTALESDGDLEEPDVVQSGT